MTSRPRVAIVARATTTTGASGLLRHGPRRVMRVMRSAKKAIARVTPTIALGTRHHGSRLARKVATGTDAAATAMARVHVRIRRRVRSEPIRPRHTSSTKR